MKSRKKDGFTILQLIVSLTILAILAAILYPVVLRSVKRAKQTSCEEKLRQISLAIELYRSDNGGAGKLGNMVFMGLPPHMINLGLPRDSYKCLGSTTRAAGAAFTYMADDTRQWVAFVQKMGGASILVLDDNHQDNTETDQSPLVTHFAFGYTVDGNFVKRRHLGLPALYDFWIDKDN